MTRAADVAAVLRLVVRHWCLTTTGQRIHGTTKARPLDRYQETEAAVLRPLPATPYDLVIWKEVKLYRDCQINFDNAYYTAPFRLVRQLIDLAPKGRAPMQVTMQGVQAQGSSGFSFIKTQEIRFRKMSLLSVCCSMLSAVK